MRAVCFGLLPSGKTTTDEFDGPGCLDRAHAFKESVEPDFPGGLFAVTGDQEAADDRKEGIMARLRGEAPNQQATGGDSE